MSESYYRWKIEQHKPQVRRSERRKRNLSVYTVSPILAVSIAAPPKLVQMPFRWNMRDSGALGSLPQSGETGYPGLRADLQTVCAKILTHSGDSRLVFVGRSPESLYDMMVGLLHGTSWQNRPCLLPISVRYIGCTEYTPSAQNMAAYRCILASLGLLPEQIAKSDTDTAFVDIVSSGTTYHSLVALLHRYALQEGTDWNAVRQKIRLIGLVCKKESSPKTWRWQQHAPWLAQLLGSRCVVKNISVCSELYFHLADNQTKTTQSYTPKCWGVSNGQWKTLGDAERAAIHFALSLTQEAQSLPFRKRFVRLLRTQDLHDSPYLRSLRKEIAVSGRMVCESDCRQ